MKAGYADMVALHWGQEAIEADFAIPGDAQNNLRVSFNQTEIIRILDEMPLSTEEDAPVEGLIPHNFAYRVEDALFWNSQSPLLKYMNPKLEHYRFVTGGMCLDVLSNSPPLLMVVRANVGPSWQSN
jgi:hypothetical protein